MDHSELMLEEQDALESGTKPMYAFGMYAVLFI